MALSSSDVSAGDDILASHYNNLRSDVRDADIDTATRYLSIPPAAFIPEDLPNVNQQLIASFGGELVNPRLDFGATEHHAPVLLPHGAIVTELRYEYFHTDAAATSTITLRKITTGTPVTLVTMATVSSVNGQSSGTDSSISSATIDNENSYYSLKLDINTNDSVLLDLRFHRIRITYTIDVSLP
jgi:hypothetical protein